MLVKRVNKFQFDVFQGEGWENWSRLASARNGHVYVERGDYIPPSKVKQLAANINPNLPTQFLHELT